MGKPIDGKELAALVSDTEQARIIADHITHSLCLIDVEHFQVHAGVSFRVATWALIAAGANYDWAITAPSGPTRAHLFFDVTAEAETEIEIYPALTFTGGVNFPARNRDLASSVVAKMDLKSGVSTTGSGPLLWEEKLGSGKKSGGGTRGVNEIILEDRVVYLFSMINRSVSPAWISPSFSWYEVTPKD